MSSSPNEQIVEEQQFQEAKAFLEALRPSHDRWSAAEGPECGWLFRGQSDASKPLVPSAWRPACPSQPTVLDCSKRRMRQRRDLLTVAEKEAEDWCSSAEVRLSSDEACKRGREVGVQWLAEHEVVVAFAKLADDVGHPVPEFDWLENYDDPNEGGISGCVTGQWSPDDVHAFAQHHGIPTLLLDWTFSPCVAAFFAAEQPRSSGVQASELAVWALRKDVLSRDASEDDETAIEYASVPRYRLPFLLAQQGCFTYAPYGSRWFLKHGTWPSVDDLLQARARANGSALADRGTVLRKLTLPRAQAQPLLTLLWKERISRAHLMPTYDHVVEAVEWRLERLVEGDGSGGSAGN